MTPRFFSPDFLGVQSDPNGLLYMRARYYSPFLCRFLNPDPKGFTAGLNFYVYANGNPANYVDPSGLQIPGPANFVMGMGNYNWPVVSDADWNRQFQAANNEAGAIEVSALGGVAVGAGGAALVTVAAPATASGLTFLGMTPEAASATVTATLGISGGIGGGLAVYNTANDFAGGNINGAAFDIGTFGGAGFVGINGGGRYIANNMGVGESSVPLDANPFTAETGMGYSPNYPNGSFYSWLSSAPTPASGGAAAAGIATGVPAAINLFGSYIPSSSTGK